MQEVQDYKVALIITYFGSFPKYFSYFLQSCGYNKNINFLIFTDAEYYHYQQYDNVIYISSDLKKFNELASSKIGFPVDIKFSYKLCDLKPMFGCIYEDYLHEYSHWGYCDIDIIFGDLAKCITPILLQKYDIISSHPRYMSGAFSIYKNIKEASLLFTKSKDFKKVLSENYMHFFDEASDVIDKLWSGYKISDFTSKIESISHVIDNSEKHKLSVKYTNIITEKLQHKITWENGCLTDNGNELYIFHFLIYKSSIYFNVSNFNNSSTYTFTQNGIFLNSIYSYTVSWFVSTFSNLTKKTRRKFLRLRNL